MHLDTLPITSLQDRYVSDAGGSLTFLAQKLNNICFWDTQVIMIRTTTFSLKSRVLPHKIKSYGCSKLRP